MALGRSALGLDSAMAPLETQLFSIRYPSKWQQTADANGGILLAPAGGAGQFGVVYGALVDTVQPSGGVSDAASLADATSALVQRLASQNEGLSQAGQLSSFTVGGTNAVAVDLRGRSPLTQSGSALVEHDWLVSFARPDGRMSYIVFVAPDRDFATLKPTFDAMVRSFRPR